MPVLLRNAEIGQVVRPPAGTYMSLNGFLLLGNRRYSVTSKPVPYVFLNPVDGFVAHTPDSAANGTFQVRDEESFMTDSDPMPAEVLKSVGVDETPFQPKKRMSGDYVFAFDDDEIDVSKMPRQALIIADILHDTGKSEFSELEIQDLLSLPQNLEQFKTKQDPMTIFRFYRSEFERRGFMKRNRSKAQSKKATEPRQSK